LKPLVSILIPAYNTEATIAQSIKSAIAQSWQSIEIIVVDDGSTDRTAAVARRFASKRVSVVSTENRGAAAARNRALQLSQGDYLQWLDADDLLAPDKIERQLAAQRETDSRRILLSSQWATFYYRTDHACSVPTSLWQDLSPVEWLLRKMGDNLHMQTATWLTSRELAEAAGPWDIRLLTDDDGEYFCRVLLASGGTRFVPGTGIFYRATAPGNLSHIGRSDKKKESMFLSMKLHIQYLRSLEDSERVRKACLAYLQTWYHNFYPERPDIVAELQSLAAQLRGQLKEPSLRWKYAWMKPVFGWRAAKLAQYALPEVKKGLAKRWDKVVYSSQKREAVVGHATNPKPAAAASLRASLPLQPGLVADSNSRRQMQEQIPRRIIQTAKSANLPLRQRAVMSNMRLLNPGYEYLFFDDAQVRKFIDGEFPQYRAVFDSFQYPIQRYDFFRYLAVYRYGGFYFDIDVLLASGLSPLLEHGCVFSFEALTISHFLRNLGMDWLMGNYAFGAAPGHAFLEAIIENCVRGQRDPDWVKPMMRGSPPLLKDEFFILNSTGPGLISRTLAENRDLAETVTILFPDDVCDVSNWNRFGEWGVHLMDSSWRPDRSLLRRKFSGYCWRWIQHMRVEESQRLGKSRYHPCVNPARPENTPGMKSEDHRTLLRK
jgi:glycosyltransferase involved in cell wall biosynthesis